MRIKLLLLIIGLLIFTSPLYAAVVYEAQAAAAGYNASQITVNITLGGASSTRAVAVGVWGLASGSITGVTVGGATATLVTGSNQTSVGNIQTYCLATSLTGSQQVKATYSGSHSIGLAAISATGVNQSTPCNGGNKAGSYGSPVAATVTSNSGDLAFSFLDSTSSTATSSQTLKASANDGTYYMYGDIGPGTGNTAFSWTIASPGGGAVLSEANFVSGTVTALTPTFNPVAATFVSGLPVSVAITSATSSVTICYTTNGNTPTAATAGTCDSGSGISSLSNGGSINVGVTETILAIATLVGDVNSAVGSSAYTILPVVIGVNGFTVGQASGNVSAFGGQHLGYVTGSARSVGKLSAPIIPADVLVNWAGLSNGVNPTLAQVNNSVFGSGCTWSVVNTNNTETGSTSGPLSGYLSGFLVGGTVFNTVPAIGLVYTTASPSGDEVVCTFVSPPTSVTLSGWIEWDIPDNDTYGNGYSMFQIEAASGQHYSTVTLLPTGTSMGLEMECTGGNSASITTHANTPYFYTMNRTNAGLASLQLFGITGAKVGATITCSSIGAVAIVDAAFGNHGDVQTAGKHFWGGPQAISLSGVYPLGP